MNLEFCGKSRGACVREGRASALHFNRDESPTGLHNKVHFVVSLAPVRDATASRGLRVGEMRANGRLHKSTQAGIFWISSSTSTAPSGPASRRAASHCWPIHSAPRRVGSSALAYRVGTPRVSVTCSTRVDFPTWRGPATTWRNRRGSASRRASSAAWGRRNGIGILLTMLSNFTQQPELSSESDAGWVQLKKCCARSGLQGGCTDG